MTEGENQSKTKKENLHPSNLFLQELMFNLEVKQVIPEMIYLNGTKDFI